MSDTLVNLIDQLKALIPRDNVPAYAELMTTSNFSFLRGGSSPEELVIAAASLGLNGLGLCDRNSFAGVVRAHTIMRQIKEAMPPTSAIWSACGSCFADGTPDIVAYPTDREAYGRLCQLLSDAANRRTVKGECDLYIEDLKAHAEGNLFILDPDETDWAKTEATLVHLKSIARKRVWLAAACRFHGDDRERLARLSDLAMNANVPLLAVNDVLYHEPRRRVMQDTVTCIREHLTIFEAGRRLEPMPSAISRYPRKWHGCFGDYPRALARDAGAAAPHRLLPRSAPVQLSRPKPSAMARRRRRRWSG